MNYLSQIIADNDVWIGHNTYMQYKIELYIYILYFTKFKEV